MENETNNKSLSDDVPEIILLNSDSLGVAEPIDTQGLPSDETSFTVLDSTVLISKNVELNPIAKIFY